jgi:hypothetical protein
MDDRSHGAMVQWLWIVVAYLVTLLLLFWIAQHSGSHPVPVSTNWAN